MRFRDIAAFVFQHPTFPYPTSSLPKISPCSPASIGGWPLGYEERRRWGQSSYFSRCPTYVIVIHQRYRQTDRRHAIARPHGIKWYLSSGGCFWNIE